MEIFCGFGYMFLYGERQNFNDSTDKVATGLWSFQMNSLLTWPLSGCAELAVNVQHFAHITNEGATKWPAWAVMAANVCVRPTTEHRSSPAAFSLFITRQQRNTRPTKTIIGDLPPLTLITVYIFSAKDSKAFALGHLATLLWRSKVCLHHLAWNESTWWYKT